jgi:hypothetical protein
MMKRQSRRQWAGQATAASSTLLRCYLSYGAGFAAVYPASFKSYEILFAHNIALWQKQPMSAAAPQLPPPPPPPTPPQRTDWKLLIQQIRDGETPPPPFEIIQLYIHPVTTLPSSITPPTRRLQIHKRHNWSARRRQLGRLGRVQAREGRQARLSHCDGRYEFWS